MKIGYKKRHLNVNLIFGLIWLVWFFIGVFGKEEPNWTDYGWIVISLMYLGMYFYQKNYNYLTIENGFIKQNWPFGKKMNLNEIKRIRHFAGEYILKSELKKMKINIQLINEESLLELKTELKKLDVEWS
ncbi:hypothetical protein N9M81_00030 [Flavobacteriaceae bacterium]|nr:hypothetical protein [Flavobacteriaceae bacterium]